MPRCNKDIPARLKRAKGCSGEIHVPCRRTKGLGSAPPRIFYQTVASTRFLLTLRQQYKIKDNNALLCMVDLKANKKKINAVK